LECLNGLRTAKEMFLDIRKIFAIFHLRFRASAIEAFIDERERLSALHTGGRRKA